MARRATIQLKVHRQVVQSIPLDEADIELSDPGVAVGDSVHAADRSPA
jgi:hypothetical protein